VCDGIDCAPRMLSGRGEGRRSTLQFPHSLNYRYPVLSDHRGITLLHGKFELVLRSLLQFASRTQTVQIITGNGPDTELEMGSQLRCGPNQFGEGGVLEFSRRGRHALLIPSVLKVGQHILCQLFRIDLVRSALYGGL
jgi:hypothetical protein